jgi:hypothetical protein
MTLSRNSRIKAALSPLAALTWRHKGDQAAVRRQFKAAAPSFPAAEVDELAERAYQDALILAELVRDEDPEVVFGALAGYGQEHLSVLAVALAALVPLDVPVSKLTEWFTWGRRAGAGQLTRFLSPKPSARAG